jgi:predicted nucleic acid-binding protein
LGWVVPVATPALFLEYEDVLLRAETLAATGLTRTDVDTVLIAIAAVVEPVAVSIDWRPLLPDPDDDMVANCAINGMADCVVTSNVRDLRLVQQRFGIRVVPPGAFVEEVRLAFEPVSDQDDFEE